MSSIQSLFESATAAHRSGRHQQALDQYQQILAIDPQHARTLSLLGKLHLELQQSDKAVGYFAKAAELKPADAGVRLDLAAVHMQLGEFKHALDDLLKVAKLQPRNPVSHACLGDVYRALNEPEKAIDSYRAALDLKPGLIPVEASLGEAMLDAGLFEEAIGHWSGLLSRMPGSPRPRINLAAAYFDNGNYDEAEKHYRLATASYPVEARGFLGLGVVLERQQLFEDAAACFKKVIELDPGNVEATGRLGCAHAQLQRYSDAEPLLERAVEQAPNAADFWNELGKTKLAQGKTAEAETAARKVLSLHPESVTPLVTLGWVCGQQGKFDESEKLLRTALDRDPENVQALTALGSINRLKPEDGGVERFTSLLRGAELDHETSRMLHASAAALLEKEGRYPEAFEHFQASADAYLASREGYDLDAHIESSEAIVRTFDRELIETLMQYGSESEQPIFITGMPRSGTTLIEQIVSSHPDVQAGGEPDFLEKLALAQNDPSGHGGSFPDTMTSFEPDDLKGIADSYLAGMNSLTGHPARFTDKSISTYLIFGLAAILFPKARFIHCMRDPLDTCLSCFVQPFDSPSHAYTYDLQQLGTIYRDYLRLMDHWRTSIPLSILEVRYEDLATDPDSHTRRIIEYCGLNWDERCLAPYKNERTVHTASAWQVRQPIYSSSIGRWKNYADQLVHLRDTIEGAAV